MEEKEEKETKRYQKNKIDISWDYAKQQNDILIRQYLQFFALYLTLATTILITTLIEKINVIIGIYASFAFFVIAAYYILKLRSVTYGLKDDFVNVMNEIDELEKLK